MPIQIFPWWPWPCYFLHCLTSKHPLFHLSILCLIFCPVPFAIHWVSIKQPFAQSVIFSFCYVPHPLLFLSFKLFYAISYLGLFSDPCWPLSVTWNLFFLLIFVHFKICLHVSLSISLFFTCTLELALFIYYVFYISSILARCFLFLLNNFHLVMIHYFISFL